jgi:hypothetical protein
MSMTRRLQILMDEERYRRVAALAQSRRVSVATVIRDAIDRGLPRADDERVAAGRRFLAAEPIDVPPTVEDLRAEIAEAYDVPRRGRAPA